MNTRDLASQCALRVGAECRMGDSAGVDGHGVCSLVSRGSLAFIVAISSGGVAVLGDNDLGLLMC